jgi:hypothetical protein
MIHSSTAASWVSTAAARMTVDLGEKLRAVPAPRDELRWPPRRLGAPNFRMKGPATKVLHVASFSLSVTAG